MNFRRKRIIFTPFLLLVLLLLSFQVSVVTGVPGDDPTTAIPISLGDTTGTMPGPGFFDEIYYIISLAGDYQFSITGPDGTDFDLYIISSLPDYFQMGKATGSDYPDIVTLLDLPADDYYVRVDTESGSGSFTLNIAEFVPTPISLGDTVDSLPGSYTDGSIWYNISLAAGDYHFSLTGPDGTDFNLDLFDKATTWPYKGLSTIGRTNGTVYPDIVTVLGLGVGLYYIQVYNVTGTGSFTLNIATGEDPTNARPINLGEFVGNLPGPAVDDSIWYVITLAAGDYQFNLTGL